MKTRPWLWSRRIWPVRHLKNVLLPAPFGPMRQRSSRSASEKLTLLTACTPPKRIDRSRVSSTVSVNGAPRPASTPDDPPRGCGPAWERPGARPASCRFPLPDAAPTPRARRLPTADARALAALAPAAERGQEAARQQEDDEDEDRAEDERVVDHRLLAEQELQEAEHDRA